MTNDQLNDKLAMKDIDEKSWFNYIKLTLELYNLPSAYTLLQQDITKPQWKNTYE